jgi:dihydroorotase
VSLVLRKVRLLDPVRRTDAISWLRLDGAQNMVSMGEGDAPAQLSDTVHDLTGLVLIPGLVDLDQVIAPPQTAGRDSADDVESNAIARALRQLHPLPQAALERWFWESLSPGTRGQWLLPLGIGVHSGLSEKAIGWLDPALPLAEATETMRAARDAIRLVVTRAQEPALEGIASPSPHGALFGWPISAPSMESARITVLSALARQTGVPLLFQRVSTAAGVAALKAARDQGSPVFGAVTIAHLTFNAVDTAGGHAAYRLSPPLGSEADRQALLEGVKRGVISVITSGHDPVRDALKNAPFAEAEPGGTLVHCLLSGLSSLIASGELDWMTALNAASSFPARLLGQEAQTNSFSSPRPLTDRLLIVHPTRAFRVMTGHVQTRAHSSPFAGRLATGCLVGYVTSQACVLPDQAGGALR